MAPTARGQERFWVTGRQNSSCCWVLWWCFLLLDPPDHSCAQLSPVFPALLLKWVVITLEDHFSWVLSWSLVFQRIPGRNYFKGQMSAGLTCSLAPGPAQPRAANRHHLPRISPLFFFFGCGVSWESLLLFQFPWVLIWVAWNINTIRVSRIPLTSIFALSLVLQALCFRQLLKWDLNY